MKEWLKYLKRWGLWIFLSYLFVGVVLYAFVIIPQKKKIIKYRTKKNFVEYNYYKLKSSPKFFKKMDEVIKIGSSKLNNFEWLNNGFDPNLLFFNYISELAEKENLELTVMERLERLEKEKPYFIWKVSLLGSFNNALNFINDIESGKKYLRIEEIEISPEEGGKTNFVFTILGVKKIVSKNE